MKVLVLGDSPFLKTGFGRVNSHAIDGFLRAGFEVAAVTGLQSNPPTDTYVKVYPVENDQSPGIKETPTAIEDFQPDCLYSTGDVASIGTFAAVVPDRLPYVTYIPVEGEPVVHGGWRAVFSYLDFITCSKYGVRVIRDSLGKEVDYIYHGVDRELFYPLTPEERDEYRRLLGWQDKFVVTCVAQNVKRKQLPRLIESIAILKQQYKQRDIILYLHTVPYQNHWLEGWNLPEITRAFGVYSEVVFNPFMLDRHSSVPETGDHEVPGLRELMGASDLFVLPSQVEGFGLPIAEAMAVGLPVMVTKYGAGWEVAREGNGVGLPPHDWEIHKSGTRYANVDPHYMAKEILRLKRNPKQRAQMREDGIEAVRLFDWSVFESAIAERVIHATEAKAQSTANGSEDQADTQAGSASNSVPEHPQPDRDEASGPVSDGSGAEDSGRETRIAEQT